MFWEETENAIVFLSTESQEKLESKEKQNYFYHFRLDSNKMRNEGKERR